jgi:hypothetical protein
MSAKKKSSGAASTPKGDREAGLNPPIPFVPKKLDDDDKPATVEITILKDPDKAATKDNTEKKESRLLRPLPVAELQWLSS